MNSLPKNFFSTVGRNTIHHITESHPLCLSTGPSTALRGIARDDFNFEETLSDLTTIARMIRPHLGSRLVSARLTFGIHCCTLPCEERCGRRTCTSITLQLSEGTGAELAVKGVLRARRLCCLRRGTAFSHEPTAGSSEAGSYRSPFCTSSRRGAERRLGVWS